MREVPASVGQRLLWLMDHYRGQHNSLNEQVLWHLREPCDIAAARRVLGRLTARHEALRTAFVTRRRQLIQLIHEPREIDLRVIDVSGEADPRGKAREVLASELVTPIDVTRWPTRATLITLDPQRHILALTMHHYISDDWSNGLLSRDIGELFAGRELPDVQWQYADWAAWQRERIEGQRGAELAAYWREHLAGASVPVLPEQARVPRRADEPSWLCVELPIEAEVTQGLHRLARQQRTTLFPVMLSLFYLVLYRAIGQQDMAVASLFANRARPEVRETVGFFVNMVLLRGRLKDGEPFTDLLRQVRNLVMEGLRHQELPSQLLPPGTLAGQGRTDDVMFQLLGSFVARADMAADELDDLEAQLERRRFALEFVVVPQGEGLTALVLCDRDRFDADWTHQLVADYVELAGLVVADPSLPVSRPS